MAINLFNKYGSRANPPSLDYPEGSVKNRSAPDVKDGTPLDADWANDHQGFFQSLLSSAGILANGLIDKVGDSQYFEALKSIISNNKSTVAELQAGTDDTKFPTPKGLKDAGLWPLGVGQSWVNVTASRSTSVTYTNTTGRPIFVSFSGSDNSINATLVVNGLTVAFNAVGSGDSSENPFVCGLIPAGATYSVFGQKSAWMELRG